MVGLYGESIKVKALKITVAMSHTNVFPFQVTLTPTASKKMHDEIVELVSAKYDLEPVEVENEAKRVIRFYEKT